MLFCAATAVAQAQSDTYVVRDLESWSTVSFKLKINDKLKTSLGQSLRLGHNSSEFQQTFTELGGSYDLSEDLSFGLETRYIRRGQDIGTSPEFRYGTFLKYKQKYDRLKLKYRLGYTNRNELGVSLEEGDERISQYRLMVGGKYNIPGWKLDPKFSTELFWRGESGTAVEKDKIRFKLGSTLDLGKRKDLDFFYGFEHEFGDRGANYYLLGVSFEFTHKLK